MMEFILAFYLVLVVLLIIYGLSNVIDQQIRKCVDQDLEAMEIIKKSK